MDDNIGTGTDFQTTMSEVTFNGDDIGAGVGTGTYTEIASSTGSIGAPNQPFQYLVDTGNDRRTFLLDPLATPPDYAKYGVMSSDTNILGFVEVNNNGSVSLMVAVKK